MSYHRRTPSELAVALELIEQAKQPHERSPQGLALDNYYKKRNDARLRKLDRVLNILILAGLIIIIAGIGFLATI